MPARIKQITATVLAALTKSVRGGPSLQIRFIQEAPGRHHHQPDRPAEIAAVNPEHELNRQHGNDPGAEACAKRGPQSLAEGERACRDQQQPG